MPVFVIVGGGDAFVVVFLFVCLLICFYCALSSFPFASHSRSFNGCLSLLYSRAKHNVVCPNQQTAASLQSIALYLCGISPPYIGEFRIPSPNCNQLTANLGMLSSCKGLQEFNVTSSVLT